MAKQSISLKFHAESNFWIYVHDKGEQYYLHYDFWPKVPFIHHSEKDEHLTDIVVTKKLEVQNEECETETYDYFSEYVIGEHYDILDFIFSNITYHPF